MLKYTIRALFATLILVGISRPAESKDRLNVLLITLDDMNRDSVGVFGSKVPETTPNIDRLARQGLRFEHAHVTIAICQPTRAVWMTGRYPHNSGALGFNHINPGVPTLPETLQANGYITGILSKTEHVVPSRQAAFDYRRNRREVTNGRGADQYHKFTAEFIDQAKTATKPFFLMVNTCDPHRPFDNLQSADERELRKKESLKKEPAAGNSKQRPRYKAYPAPSRIYTPDEIVVPRFVPDLPPIRKEIAQYYSSVRRADDVVGSVLSALEKAGVAQNTLVMLKSDHGIAVPFAKTNVWRHSTITPWIVRWPNVIKPNRCDTEHVVAGVDLAPTILDALDIAPMEAMDGHSILPILKGEKQDDCNEVYTYINTIASRRSYTMRSIQDKRYGLIWNGWSNGKTIFRNESQAGLTWKTMVAAAEKDPAIAARVKHYSYRTPWEFYDYEKDPDALHNLIHDPASQNRIDAMRKKLVAHAKRTGDGAFEKLQSTPITRVPSENE